MGDIWRHGAGVSALLPASCPPLLLQKPAFDQPPLQGHGQQDQPERAAQPGAAQTARRGCTARGSAHPETQLSMDNVSSHGDSFHCWYF